MAFIAKLTVTPGEDDDVNLQWDFGLRHEFQCYYSVDRKKLLGPGENIRKELQRLADIRSGAGIGGIDREQYKRVLRDLSSHSDVLRINMFQPDGENQSEIDDLVEYLRSKSKAVEYFEEKILLLDGSEGTCLRRQQIGDVFVVVRDDKFQLPWGFLSIDRPTVPKDPRLDIRDLQSFFIGSFDLRVNFGSTKQIRAFNLPGEIVYALHEELHDGARAVLKTCYPEAHVKLGALLKKIRCKRDNWDDIYVYWDGIKDSSDSILYFFGHSDGELVFLQGSDEDAAISDPSKVLQANAFRARFRKSKSAGTSSIAFLNGCRSSSSGPMRPWASSFLAETRFPGFFGFVGAEAVVPNHLACVYGSHLLHRLYFEHESVGEAYDALLLNSEAFPVNVMYTCLANREFRISSIERNRVQSEEVAA